MIVSRRNLLRQVAATGVATVTVPTLAGRALDAASGGGLRAGGPVGAGGLIRLDRNENAYGPSAKVLATIRETTADAAGRYASLPLASLRAGIAAFHAI